VLLSLLPRDLNHLHVFLREAVESVLQGFNFDLIERGRLFIREGFAVSVEFK
jgi:hypothetical protein